MIVYVSDTSLFVVGQTYVSYSPAGVVDPGSFLVTAISAGVSVTVTPILGWVSVDGHGIYAVGIIGNGRGFSFEVVSFDIALEKGLNKIAPSKRGQAP